MTRWRLRLGEVCEARCLGRCAAQLPKFLAATCGERIALGEANRGRCLPHAEPPCNASHNLNYTSLQFGKTLHKSYKSPKHIGPAGQLLSFKLVRQWVTCRATKLLTIRSCPQSGEGRN